MTCIIIEDQPPAQRILKKYIEDIGSLELKGVFSDAIQAISFLNSNEIDLLFLDIHLPKLSGLDFLKTVPQLPSVILTTAFSEYALESYEFSVVDYLLKPFSFQRFVKAVSKVQLNNQSESLARVKGGKTNEIFIKSGYEHIKIVVNDICYIKSDADYTEIHLATKKHLSTESLRYWEANLDQNQFVRTHKSYIVNSRKIEKVVGSQTYLTNGTSTPIGRVYKENFIKRFVK